MSSNVLAFPETIPSGFKIASHSGATAYSANIPVQTQDLPLFYAGGPIVSGPAVILVVEGRLVKKKKDDVILPRKEHCC